MLGFHYRTSAISGGFCGSVRCAPSRRFRVWRQLRRQYHSSGKNFQVSSFTWTRPITFKSTWIRIMKISSSHWIFFYIKRSRVVMLCFVNHFLLLFISWLPLKIFFFVKIRDRLFCHPQSQVSNSIQDRGVVRFLNRNYVWMGHVLPLTHS